MFSCLNLVCYFLNFLPEISAALTLKPASHCPILKSLMTLVLTNVIGCNSCLLRAATDESQKTRNKKQNGLVHSRFIVCVTPKQKKKHCLIRESSFSGACAKEPINNLSQVTWLCTWLPK